MHLRYDEILKWLEPLLNIVQFQKNWYPRNQHGARYHIRAEHHRVSKKGRALLTLYPGGRL